MTDFETAKQFNHHQEYQKAIYLIVKLLKKKIIKEKSIEYAVAFCYLGDSRLALYEITKNKSLIYEALTDFATAANNLLFNDNNPSDDLKRRIRKCCELIKTCP